MSINTTPRKHPRTLSEAFGPYTSNHIEETHDPMPREDKVMLIFCGCAAAVLLVLVAVGVIV